jgi:hypothetical protein
MEFIEALAERMADNMELDDLIQYYYEGTIDYLDDLTDDDLLEQAEWSGFETEEYQEFLGE